MWRWGECRVQSDELKHYGISGQKWGIRRFQNEDGTLTEEGKERYYSKIKIESKKITDTNYECDRHTFKSEGSDKFSKFVDEFADSKDYDSADNWFSLAGVRAINAYIKQGKEAAKKELAKGLKGVKFEYSIDDEKRLDTGEKYTTFSLTVYGNKYTFSSAGEDGSIDDQEFRKI